MRLRMGPVLDASPPSPRWPPLPIDERRRAVADPATRARLRDEAERAGRGPLAALADGSLVEIAESDHWGGRTVAEVAAAVGVDTVDVLIDVVLVDGAALTMVLPTLVPSLGATDEGWAARVDGLAGPPGPPRRFRRRRPRRHDVPRQLPDGRPG